MKAATKGFEISFSYEFKNATFNSVLTLLLPAIHQQELGEADDNVTSHCEVTISLNNILLR